MLKSGRLTTPGHSAGVGVPHTLLQGGGGKGRERGGREKGGERREAREGRERGERGERGGRKKGREERKGRREMQ